MADGKISADSNLASPAAGDLIPIVDIDVADSLKNKTVTWSQIETAFTETNNLSVAVTWANIPIANVPTGTTGSTVALGNHLHSGVYEPVDTTLVRATITTIGTGEILKWNGSAWVNNLLSEAGIAADDHIHSTYDNVAAAYTGPNVFSQLSIADGIVTGIAARALTAGDVGAATSGHIHDTFDYSTTLSGANVFSAIAVTDGIVTGLANRALTPANIGALSSLTADANSGIVITGSGALTIGFQSSLIAERTGTLVGTDRLTGATSTTDFCETINAIPLSIFNNDQSWTSNAGTVISVTAGNGMTQTGGTSPSPVLNVVSHAGSAGTIGTVNIGADAIGVNLGATSTTAAVGNHTHLLAAGATDVNATAAEVNILDLSATALTAGWVYRATGASTAAWGLLTHANLGSVDANQHIDWTSAPASAFESLGIDDNATSTAITIDATENVGIGIVAPLARLAAHVQTASDVVIKATREGISPLGIDFYSWSSSWGSMNGGINAQTNSGWASNIWTDNHLTFGTGGSTGTEERMRITSTGDVGIGTTTPDQKLEVESTGEVRIRLKTTGASSNSIMEIVGGSSSNSQLHFQNSSAPGTMLGRIRYQHTSNFMEFTTNTVERMRITSAGDVGIGNTPSGTYKLEVTGKVGSSNGFASEVAVALHRNTTAQTLEINGGTAGNGGTIALHGSTSGSAGDIVFSNDGGSTERMRLTAAGDLDIANGDILMTTAGTGIDFSAATPDGTGTTGSEILDDYEEGTWSPLYSDGTFNASAYTIRVGSYVKIGKQVTVKLRVRPSNIGSVAGNLRFKGLPFTSDSASNSDGAACVGYAVGMALTAGESLTGYIAASSTNLFLRQYDVTTGNSPCTNTEFPVNGEIMITATYEVA